jgi:hypothetical protein
MNTGLAAYQSVRSLVDFDDDGGSIQSPAVDWSSVLDPVDGNEDDLRAYDLGHCRPGASHDYAFHAGLLRWRPGFPTIAKYAPSRQ